MIEDRRRAKLRRTLIMYNTFILIHSVDIIRKQLLAHDRET